ncbi:hypothetical protein [Promicromonospora sp. NPDC050262]|uniref:hypothetical protein n=1 Tax=Promicromonospora sp. NPDC050262 TaxID=3155036 RepID=UPI0033FCF5BC
MLMFLWGSKDGLIKALLRRTREDELGVLAARQPAPERDAPDGAARRTLALAVLRGALLDLLATDDEPRVTGAVALQLSLLRAPR